MKSDSKTLLWGILVAAVIAAAAWVLPSEFPNLGVSSLGDWFELAAVTAIILIALIRAYKSLWKRRGFWLLVCALLVVHVLVFKFVVFRFTASAGLPATSAAFALGAGAEILAFTLIIQRVYHVWPTGQPLTW